MLDIDLKSMDESGSEMDVRAARDVGNVGVLTPRAVFFREGGQEVVHQIINEMKGE